MSKDHLQLNLACHCTRSSLFFLLWPVVMDCMCSICHHSAKHSGNGWYGKVKEFKTSHKAKASFPLTGTVFAQYGIHPLAYAEQTRP